MKYLFLIIFFILSGCVNLSKQNHMMISEEDVEYSDSFCGYGSAEWGQFGSENRAVFSNKDINVSFCSNAFYSKNIAAGFIFPIIPIDGREHHAKRWVKVSNLSAEQDLHLQASLQFCKSRYPYENCGLDTNEDDDTIILKQGESGWISLPDEDVYDLKIKSNEVSYTFTFTKKTAYSWWMITV